MTGKTWQILVMAWVGLLPTLHAQSAQGPTLHEILTRVQNNLDNYDASVPSFFCNEHIDSSRVGPGRKIIVSADSVFRLKRTPAPDKRSILVESREIHLFDGKPAVSQQLNVPTLPSGFFEGALAAVSLNQVACMKYELQKMNEKKPTPYIVGFSTLPVSENPRACLLQEKSKGRVAIDPASMQIMHLEMTTPRHAIVDQTGDDPLFGKREIKVDYAPVKLGSATYWMPSEITMRVSGGSGGMRMPVWSFHAAYRDYRKLEVTSRILPAGGDGP